MPKAAVNEDHGAILGQDNIWCAGEIASMKPKPVSHLMQQASYEHLRFRVPRANGSHDARSLRIVRSVLHHQRQRI